MSSNNVGLASEAYIATGKDLVSGKKSNLLFNRIINVKFTRAREVNGKRSFTIRSDYEPVYNKDGTISFAPCGFKPSIRLKYNQVAAGLSVSVRLEVDGLYIDRETVGDRLDAADGIGDGAGNPVMHMEIQIGYIDDFPRWDKATPLTDIDRFYELDSMEDSGRQLSVTVIGSYRTGTPPDSTWVFNGVLATMDTGLRWKLTPENMKEKLKNNYGYADFPAKKSYIETVLYQTITRRFIRASIPSQAQITAEQVGDELVEVNTYKVLDYNYLTGGGDRSGKYEDVETTDDNLMTAKAADAIGVQCFCSEILKNTYKPSVLASGTHGEKADKVLQDTAVVDLFTDFQDSLPSQLKAIKQQFDAVRFYQLADGNFYFYSVAESDADLSRDPFVAKMQMKRPVCLTAVYDITVGGMRTIRAPFRQIISPMTTVVFQSRYHLVDGYGGFYTSPSKNLYGFIVELCSIEFSTNGKENMVTMMCVDIAQDNMPVVDFTGNQLIPQNTLVAAEQTYSNDPDEKANKRKYGWTLLSYTVGDYPYDRAGLGWVDIARGLIECCDPEDWGSGIPDIGRALADLKSWNSDAALNPDLTWRAAREKNDYGYSPENKLVRGLSFKIPWIQNGDKFVIKQPYKPEYKDEYRMESQ